MLHRSKIRKSIWAPPIAPEPFLKFEVAKTAQRARLSVPSPQRRLSHVASLSGFCSGALRAFHCYPWRTAVLLCCYVATLLLPGSPCAGFKPSVTISAEPKDLVRAGSLRFTEFKFCQEGEQTKTLRFSLLTVNCLLPTMAHPANATSAYWRRCGRASISPTAFAFFQSVASYPALPA